MNLVIKKKHTDLPALFGIVFFLSGLPEVVPVAVHTVTVVADLEKHTEVQ